MLIRKLWPSLVWALVILVLTGLPGKYIPEVVGFWDWIGPDKFVHVFIFGTLSFLIFYNLRAQYRASNKRFIIVISIIGVTLAYALLTEILQATVFIGRDGNVYDFLANTVGAFSGWFMFSIVFRKK
jgi:VanZ family protein